MSPADVTDHMTDPFTVGATLQLLQLSLGRSQSELDRWWTQTVKEESGSAHNQRLTNHLRVGPSAPPAAPRPPSS